MALGSTSLPRPLLIQRFLECSLKRKERNGILLLQRPERPNNSPRPHRLANRRRGTRTHVSQAPVQLGLPHGGSAEPGLSTSGGEAALSEGTRERKASELTARQPPPIPNPPKVSGSGKRNTRGTEPQTVAAHSPQLWVCLLR